MATGDDDDRSTGTAAGAGGRSWDDDDSRAAPDGSRTRGGKPRATRLAPVARAQSERPVVGNRSAPAVAGVRTATAVDHLGARRRVRVAGDCGRSDFRPGRPGG